MTNGPFRIFLSSEDEGSTISWKIMDKAGRVHFSGRDPMPDFAAGGGMMLTMEIQIEAEDDINPLLGKLPIDAAVVEKALGSKFMEALRGDSSAGENHPDQV